MLKILKQIGEGSESKVFLADKDGEKVVVKEFKSGFGNEARREYLFLKTIAQPGVVEAIAFENNDTPRLILQYLEGVPLSQKLPENPEKFLSKLFEIVLRIHNYGIVINDLKPDNIMILDDVPCLIDLSFATINGYNDGKFRGTPAFAAPEKFKFNSNTTAADIFSLGLICLIISGKKVPGKYRNREEYIPIITDPEKWNALVAEIDNEEIKKMLSFRPENRTSLLDIIKSIDSDWKGNIKDLKNVTFESQIDLVNKLFINKEIFINPEDEPRKIAQLCQIKSESNNEQIIVLNEEEYLKDSEAYLLTKGIENISDILRKTDQGINYNILLVENIEVKRSRLFRELEEQDKVYKIIIDKEIDPIEIKLEELLLKSKPYNIAKTTLKNLSNNSPANIRKIIASKGGKIDEKFINLLSLFPVGLSLKVINNFYPNWENSVIELLKNGIATLQYGRIFTSEDRNGKIDKKFVERILKYSSAENDLQTAIYAAKYLDEEQEINKNLYKYITKLVKKELYISAVDFLEFATQDLNILELPLPLAKRRAFLLRKIGEFDNSIADYEKLLTKIEGLERAVILSDKAVVTSEIGDLEKALLDLKEAANIFLGLNDQKKYIRTMNNIGFTLYQMDDLSKAGRIFRDVLNFAEQNKLDNWKVIALLNLADVSLQQGQWEKAEHFASQVAKSAKVQKKYAYELQGKMLSAMAMAARGSSQDYDKSIREFLENPHIKENQQLAVAVLEGSLALYILSGQTSLKLRQKIKSLYKQVQDLSYPEVDDAAFWLAIMEKDFLKANEIAGKHEKHRAYHFLIKNNQAGLKTEMQDLMIRDRVYQLVLLASNLLNYYGDNSEIYQSIVENLQLSVANPPILQLKQKTEGNIDLVWEIISSIMRSGDSEEVLEQTLLSLLKIGKMERAVYFNLTGGETSMQLALGKNGRLRDADIAVSKTILRDSIAKDSLSFYQNLQEEMAGGMNSSIFGLGLRSAVCFPLNINGQIKGVFYSDTGDDKGFSAGDKVYLEVIFNQSNIQLEKLELMQRVSESKNYTNSEESFHGIIGHSKPMLDIYENIRIIAKHNINILITGETGTGKELVARAIHQEYNSDKPFIAINCSAIPEQLLESELFGYKKGAFTGADMDKKGLFEAAGDGVLFLDEIGEMPLSLQPKVLRVLQERKITALGSLESKDVKMRIIAATNRDLEQLSKSGEFRQDLLFRLSVFQIKLPSLEERKDDVPALAYSFIEKYSRKFDKEILGIEPDLLKMLQQKGWEGNVRELENYIEKAVVLCQSKILDHWEMDDGIADVSQDLSIPISWGDFMKYKKDRIKNLEEEYLNKLLSLVQNNYSAAARLAKTNRIQLYRLRPNESKK